MYTNYANTATDLIIGSPDQLEKKLKIAQEGEREAKRQHAAGERVLTRVRDEKNKLQDSNTKLVLGNVVIKKFPTHTKDHGAA